MKIQVALKKQFLPQILTAMRTIITRTKVMVLVFLSFKLVTKAKMKLGRCFENIIHSLTLV